MITFVYYIKKMILDMKYPGDNLRNNRNDPGMSGWVIVSLAFDSN
jgi:hypothetical protein